MEDLVTLDTAEIWTPGSLLTLRLHFASCLCNGGNEEYVILPGLKDTKADLQGLSEIIYSGPGPGSWKPCSEELLKGN